MSDGFDNFIDELQNKIFDETLKDYGEKAFKRWLNPLYMYPMANPDGYGKITGPCGDTMEIFLRFKEGRVSEASFRTDGCGASMICGSIAAELALGKEPEVLDEITNETILATVGGLPEEERHCALLAANTLHESVARYRKK